MKVLCFGDSIIWGYKPNGGGLRFDKSIRCIEIASSLLGEGYEVVEDGLCGRGTDAPEFFIKSIKKYYPFDVIIIMLGANDLRQELNYSPEDVSNNVANFAKIILDLNYEGGKTPKIVLAAPTHIKKGVSTSKDASMFGLKEDSVEKSQQLAEHYKNRADELGLYFFDAAKYAEASDIDSLHLDEEGHRKLGVAFADFIKTIKII